MEFSPGDGEDQGDRSSINFDPPIKVENDFCKLTCFEISFPVDRDGLNRTGYRDHLVQLLGLVIGHMEQKLNARYRETPWPEAHRQRPDLETYFEDFLKTEMAAALKEVLSKSPEGVSNATNAFCRMNAKQRIRSFLEDAAKERGLDLQEIVRETEDGIYLRFDSVPKELLVEVMSDYSGQQGSPWISQISNMVAFNILSIPSLTQVANETVSFYVEGSSMNQPDIFTLEVNLRMKPLPEPLSLADTRVNSIADEFFTRLEMTDEDQEEDITTEALEVPANLVSRIAERYRHMKAKMEDFLEDILGSDAEGPWYFSGADSDDSDEEGDDIIDPADYNNNY